MTTTTIKFGTYTAYTITVNNLADGSGVESSNVDLGPTTPPEISIKCNLDGAFSSCVDYVEIYVKWSDDATPDADDTNIIPVGVVLMNGTTAVEKMLTVPVGARYHNLYVINESGAAMAASGNTIEYSPVTIESA